MYYKEISEINLNEAVIILDNPSSSLELIIESILSISLYHKNCEIVEKILTNFWSQSRDLKVKMAILLGLSHIARRSKQLNDNSINLIKTQLVSDNEQLRSRAEDVYDDVKIFVKLKP